MSKEMLGGCCVCSDERGWTENPLVYCDGQGCTVAVHQACYGIVTVPTGPWFCRKCESQERAARVRCELCPSKDGALKRTDNSGWAHVVCALYIPEVRFGNVTTMEPIILQLIPTERFSKVCYLCQEQGKGAKSTVGACMQCNKAGCKLQFHVTCAQALGLLCEEAGNYLDNVKYCGYCQHHYSKLKKGGNVKTIPPYKPISVDTNGSSDSSPEKETESSLRSSTSSSAKKKGIVVPKASGPAIKSKSHSPAPSPTPESSSLQTLSETTDNKSNESGGLKIGTTTSHSFSQHEDQKKKFTTSNFVEIIVTQSEPVFGSDKSLSNEKNNSKKRKVSGGGSVQSAGKSDNVSVENMSQSGSNNSGGSSVSSNTTSPSLSGLSVNLKNPTVSITNLKTNVIASASKSSVNVSGSMIKPSTSASSGGSSKSNLTVSGSGTKITISTQRDNYQQKVDNSKKTKQEGGVGGNETPTTTASGGSNTSGIVVSVPLTATTLTTNSEGNLSGTSSTETTASTGVNSTDNKSSEVQAAKRARSTSSEKSRKSKRNPTNQSKRLGRSASGSTLESNEDIKPSPPDSPTEDKKLKKKPPSTVASGVTIKTEEKDVKIFQNGANIPHMLGNQLNPSSVMAQKMHDSLSKEVEAHSIFTNEPNTNNNLVGPQLHHKVIASVRSAVTTESPACSSTATTVKNVISGANSNSTQTQTLAQLLERQWEQGSQFLMEQAQHFDIASLLSCLYQLKAENLKLEETVNGLLQRRDHLLAVNARLAVPLTTQQPPQVSQASGQPNTSTVTEQRSSSRGQQQATQQQQPQHPAENDVSSESNLFTHNRGGGGGATVSTQQTSSSTIRHVTTSSYSSQSSIVRAPGSVDQRRTTQNNYSGYHGQVPVVTSPSMGVRRDDLHQQM